MAETVHETLPVNDPPTNDYYFRSGMPLVSHLRVTKYQFPDLVSGAPAVSLTDGPRSTNVRLDSARIRMYNDHYWQGDEPMDAVGELGHRIGFDKLPRCSISRCRKVSEQ